MPVSAERGERPRGGGRDRRLLALLLAIAYTTFRLCLEPEVAPFLPNPLRKLSGHARMSTSAVGFVIEYLLNVGVLWLSFWVMMGIVGRRASGRR